MKAIINGSVIVPDNVGNFKILEDHIVVFDKNIQSVVKADKFPYAKYDDIFDAKGCYVSPGFINAHIHGCGGYDVMDDKQETLSVIRKYQAQTGVTAFLPTTMTYDMPRIYRAFERIRAAKNIDEGAAVLGCHMEGPFINKDRKGAQAAENIIKADFSLIEEYKDVIRIVTLAPETLEGDYGFVRKCHENNIAKQWQKIKKQAGIDDLRFHDLRHEAATRLAEQGLTVPQIQQYTLHDDWNSLKRYVNLDIIRKDLLTYKQAIEYAKTTGIAEAIKKASN